MNILVLGHGEHGKGTACKIIKKLTGMDSLSSSAAAFPYIWPAFDEATDHKYDTAKCGYANRGKHRLLMKELILLLNSPDKTTLSKIITSAVPIYDGMRSYEEFEASKHMFQLILWVDGSERNDDDPSMEIPYDPSTMTRIDNNGSLAQLELILSEFCEKYFNF